jgi:hypothetical protein
MLEQTQDPPEAHVADSLREQFSHLNSLIVESSNRRFVRLLSAAIENRGKHGSRILPFRNWCWSASSCQIKHAKPCPVTLSMANLSEIMGTKIWADKPADWRPTTNEQSEFLCITCVRNPASFLLLGRLLFSYSLVRPQHA